MCRVDSEGGGVTSDVNETVIPQLSLAYVLAQSSIVDDSICICVRFKSEFSLFFFLAGCN